MVAGFRGLMNSLDRGKSEVPKDGAWAYYESRGELSFRRDGPLSATGKEFRSKVGVGDLTTTPLRRVNPWRLGWRGCSTDLLGGTRASTGVVKLGTRALDPA